MLDCEQIPVRKKPMLFRIFSYILFLPLLSNGTQPYEQEILKWRQAYEADLKKDNGWLTLAGLFWLKDGDNSFGSGLGNDIVLPPSAPETAGTFQFHDGKTLLRVKSGINVSLNGKPVLTAMPLHPDTAGRPDRIAVGPLSMMVIQRGQRYGIRLWDNDSAARRQFQGVKWFPVNEAYRVTAQFTSYAKPKLIPILNILGDTELNPSPGFAGFHLPGGECRLEPVLEGNELFFIFKDATSGTETYPAGRFLYADLPKDGKVSLDFNKAHNPPCAFTGYATCPLPPRQNHLAVRIEAGERNYTHH